MFMQYDSAAWQPRLGKAESKVTLGEIFSIDPRIKEALAVTSVQVNEDPTLPDSCPWRIVRRASQDTVGNGAKSQMEAEVRLSPQLAHRCVRGDRDVQAHVRQIIAVFSRLVPQVDSKTLEVSLDSSLPYSKPYRCLNRPEPRNDGSAGYVTEIAISSDFVKHIEESPKYLSSATIMNFELDANVLASQGFYTRPSAIEGMIEVVSNDLTTTPYLIAEPVKRVIDVFMVSLERFHPAANRYELPPSRLIDSILLRSTALHQLQHAIDAKECEQPAHQAYERGQQLEKDRKEHLVALSEAIAQTRTSYGDAVSDALITSIDLCEGEVGAAYRYVRDFWTIHGYRFGKQQERLEHIFEARPLSRIIDANNEECRQRIQRGGSHILQPETTLFLNFRLSSTDMTLPPRADIQLSAVREKAFDFDNNERLVCVTLTPQALRLLLDAPTPEDESIQPLFRDIDAATERLFRVKPSPSA